MSKSSKDIQAIYNALQEKLDGELGRSVPRDKHLRAIYREIDDAIKAFLATSRNVKITLERPVNFGDGTNLSFIVRPQDSKNTGSTDPDTLARLISLRQTEHRQDRRRPLSLKE